MVDRKHKKRFSITITDRGSEIVVYTWGIILFVFMIAGWIFGPWAAFAMPGSWVANFYHGWLMGTWKLFVMAVIFLAGLILKIFDVKVIEFEENQDSN